MNAQSRLVLLSQGELHTCVSESASKDETGVMPDALKAATIVRERKDGSRCFLPALSLLAEVETIPPEKLLTVQLEKLQEEINNKMFFYKKLAISTTQKANFHV